MLLHFGDNFAFRDYYQRNFVRTLEKKTVFKVGQIFPLGFNGKSVLSLY